MPRANQRELNGVLAKLKGVALSVQTEKGEKANPNFVEGTHWHLRVHNVAPTNPTHHMVLIGLFVGPYVPPKVELPKPGFRRILA